MGCCASTNKDSKFNKVGSESLKPKPTHESRAPPPSSPDQEETVKEVLSETTKQNPPPEPIKNPTEEQQHQDNNDTATGKIAHFQPTTPPLFDEKIKIQESRCKNEKVLQQEEIFEEEESEVCSLSLSEKLSTTSINNGSMDYYDDCNDEEEVVKPRVMKSPAPPKLASRNRVPAGELGTKRDRPPPPVGKSPTRVINQSSNRRNNAVRSAQSGEQMARRGLRSDPNKRDPGESSGRRSRSPATNRSAAMGRTPSAGKANQSPGRVRADPPERGGNVMKMERGSGMEGNNWPSSATKSTAGSGAGNGNESLENPLVSLECFIFL